MTLYKPFDSKERNAIDAFFTSSKPSGFSASAFPSIYTKTVVLCTNQLQILGIW